MNDFLKYIKNERESITKALGTKWLSHPPEERVAIENLLIAYDQMAGKVEIYQKSLEYIKQHQEIIVGKDNTGLSAVWLIANKALTK